MSDLEVIVAKLSSLNPAERLAATAWIRRKVCEANSPPTQALVDLGAIPILLGFLSPDSPEDLQYESCWALGNIGSGSSVQTKALVEGGALGKFTSLLASSNPNLRETALLGLANIAGDSPTLRDLVISHGVIPVVVELLGKESSVAVLHKCIWLLSNCCRGVPAIPWDVAAMIVPVIVKLLDSEDQELLSYAAWSVQFLADSHLQNVIALGVIPRMVELVASPNFPLAVLRFLGLVFLDGTNQQTEMLLKSSVLTSLSDFLSSPKRPEITKEACWIISNINARDSHHIQQIIEADIIQSITLLYPSTTREIQTEMIWALSNAILCGNPDQVRHVVECGAFGPLCDVLMTDNVQLLLFAVRTVDKAFQVGEAEGESVGTHVNYHAIAFEEFGGWERLRALLDREANIRTPVELILRKYCN